MSAPSTSLICERSEKDVFLDTGAIRLGFHIGQQLILRELASPATGNVIADLGGIGDIWKVTLLGPDNTDATYPTLWGTYTGAEFDTRGEETVLRLNWNLRLSRRGEGKVQVLIRAAAGSAFTHWSLRVEAPPDWKVTKVEFPMIPGIQTGVLPKAAVPTGWGAEYDLAKGVTYPGQYPSWEAGMQMVAFYGRGTGLYIAAHDPAACLKNLTIDAMGPTARYAMVNFPVIPEETGQTYELPFETVIGFYAGDWVEAARIYREFTFTTPWGNIPVVSKRGIPQWMQDTDLWLRPDGAAADNLEITKKALEYFGGNTTLHWYRWHEVEYDVDYPEYFPSTPGFADGIAELQKCGTHVIPYINGRIWDPDSKSWTEKNAVRSAAKDERGHCYSEIYGSKIPNNVMCPTTQLWRDTIADIVGRMFNELGTDGVYIDQICAARGVPCHDPSHGHPIGGGSVWHYGYRGLMNQVRKHVPAGRVLTTEECSEPWLDQFDAHINVNTPMELNSIPLFAAVYSDRTIAYGFRYYTKDEPENAIPFRQKNSRALLYGGQLGWIQPQLILAPGVEKEASFLRDLAHTRSHARPFVTDGQFLRLLNVTGDNPIMDCRASGGFSADYAVQEPAVNASAWKAGGQLGVLLCNISDESRAVTVPLPLDEAGVRTQTLHIAGPDGKFTTKQFTGNQINITIPPRTAMVLKS